nr:hypothetical protein [Flavobacterium sp. ASV13]
MNNMQFYNTYNARYIAPNEVGEKFIYSDSYGKLLQNNHSVILGARGCGKTTLMKMLTLPALNNWKDKRAKQILNGMEFYSVYISTDIYWDSKNQTYDKQLCKFGDLADRLSRFTVNSNVFISFCDTLLNIMDYETSIENNDLKEVEFCKELIDVWQLENTIPKIEYVRESLLKRIDKTNVLIQNIIFNYENESNLPLPDYFNLQFDSSLSFIAKVFTRVYKVKKPKKWALCFDELEFAPEWLQVKLYGSLRSRDQNFLYKISSSPILPKDIEKHLTSTYSGSPGNDLDLIKMWNLKSNEEFSKRLIESILIEKFNNTNGELFFGSNPLYIEGKESYDDDSKYMNEIKELSSKDESFRRFLISKLIDPDDPKPTSESQKDSIFRKIKPTVFFRNHFISSNLETFTEMSPSLRTRKKAVNLYNGIELLCKICEGNPRWIILLTNSIISRVETDKARDNIQYDEIMKISRRFINSIDNIPIKLKTKDLSMKNFVDKIGNFMGEQIYGAKFNIEPRLIFTYDQKNILSEDYKKLLEKGLLQGAFILVDSQNESFDFDIEDKRLKLSYMYYPKYRLPIRKSEPVNLSAILTENFNTNTLFDQLL